MTGWTAARPAPRRRRGTVWCPAALRDGKRLVAVVLGAEGEGTHIESFSESARLYDYGYNNFSKQLVVSTEDVFRQPVALSKETDCVMLYPAENAEAFLPSDVTKDQLEQTVTLKNEVADAPITRGQEMGTLTISYNGQVCVTVPLLAQADVSASRFLVAKAAVEEFLSRTIVKVALVVLVLLVILLVLWAKVFRRNRATAAATADGIGAAPTGRQKRTLKNDRRAGLP